MPSFAALAIPRTFAPNTAGKESKNEYLTAKSRSSPVAIPAEIVVPERESPGIVAMAWHKPMTSASRTRIDFSPRSPGCILSATKSRQPVRIKAAPIKNVW